MVNEDLVGGIEVALSKGKNLKDIMISYFNSGYKKAEIEEAAMITQRKRAQMQTPIIQPKTNAKPVQTPKTNQKVQQPPTTQQPKQKVSEYGKKKLPKKPKGKFFFIILILLLIIAGAVAISYFFFQEEAETLISQILG
jgi:hypothetical protein